ncbi:hypothetical protein RISK_003844 [Rhodopirellula islandica]|uniref:Transmembrane protein n=1 Tax=Rhodopirellula islandica TaxID=595434 RepID=A0A0J1BCH2_RHOIS|nr:peptidase [Rhodopirellula islandica]KLU04258.1 hypothetical protein RISK_003844 [Rhodopirellula islandica]
MCLQPFPTACLAVLSALMTLGWSSVGQSQGTVTWHSTAGSSVNAELLRIDDSKLYLQMEGNRSPVEVPLDSLTAESRLQAMQIWYNERDAKQFQMIRQHLPGMYERPGAVSRLLLEIHKAIPESPYAGIWAGVGLSEGENNLELSKRLLLQAIKRIEAQQEVMAGRHSMTLASARNNLGVVALKQQEANPAASSFIAGVQSSNVVSAVLEHNMQLLAQTDSQRSGLIELAPRLRSELLVTLASADVSTSKPNLKESLYYTLDFDLPIEAGAGNRKIEGLDSPSVFMELVAIGTGFVVSPGMVLTSTDVITNTESDGPKMLTVGSYQHGIFKTLTCKNCLMTAPKISARNGIVIRTNTTVGSVTRFRITPHRAGSSDAELAALHVPGLDLTPLCIADDTPGVASELKLYGYDPGQNLVKEGVQEFLGSVSTEPNRQGVQNVSNETTGGNRGGPLMGDDKAVHGIVFAMSKNELETGGRAFGARMIRSWFNRNVRTTSLTSVEDLPLEKRFDPKASVVPVFVWGVKSGNGLFSDVADGTGPSESLMIENTWCVACMGTAYQDCPNCVNGAQSYRKREVVSSSRISGDVYAPVVKKKRCPTCKGAGKLRCPHCDHGRLDTRRR